MINLAKLLKLSRPLAVLDVETTGLGDLDRIIQIAAECRARDPLTRSSWRASHRPPAALQLQLARVHLVVVVDVDTGLLGRVG